MEQGGGAAGLAGAPDMLETGVPNVARAMGGGLRRGSLTMVIGAPGNGKTILAQQIAFHLAERGAPTLFLTGYSETHDKLIAHSRGLRFFAPARIGQQIQFVSLTGLLGQAAAETADATLAPRRPQRAARGG